MANILKVLDNESHCDVELLAQCTGSGKHCVVQLISTVKCSVTFVVETTSSLGSDQSSNFEKVNSVDSLVLDFSIG